MVGEGRSPATVGQLHELPPLLLAALLSPTPPNAKSRRGVALDTGTIDWTRFADDVNAHALGVLVWERLKELQLSTQVPTTIAKAWEADALHARLQCALQRQDAFEISGELSRRYIRHAFLKGFAYRESLYRPTWTRIGGDTDILVDYYNVEAARRAMLDLGFIQASSTIDYHHFLPATPQQIHETEIRHYELGQFVRPYRINNPPAGFWDEHFIRKVPYTFEQLGDAVLFYSVVDIHWALHFVFAGEFPLNSTIMWRSGPTDSFPSLSPEWSLFTTCFKLYFEAFDRPRYGYHHLVDIIALLKSFPRIYHWQSFRNLINRYELHPMAFYTLSAAHAISGRTYVPDDLLREWADFNAPNEKGERLNVNGGYRRSANDHGDFLPCLIGRRIRARFQD